MKNFKIFNYSGFVLILLMLFFSCSKDNDTKNNQGLKSNAAGDKTFTGQPDGYQFAKGKFNNMIANYNAQYNFANNTGNNNYTGDIPQGGAPGSGSGSFSKDGDVYPLYFGIYEGWGEGWFDLYLLDKVPTNYDEPLIDFNGVMFELKSNSLNEISSGTYYYSYSEEPYTFEWAEVAINGNTASEEYYDFEDGMLSFARSGDTYTISFEGVLDDGSSVSGNYSGQLANIDDEPEPPPPPPQTCSMSANIDGSSWTAQDIYAEVDDYEGYLIINGTSGDYPNATGIFISLDQSQVYSGANLSSQNGGVLGITYMSYDMYYNSTYNTTYVYISSYNSNTISGTFEFEAEDYYSGDNVSITNGSFSDVTVY